MAFKLRPAAAALRERVSAVCKRIHFCDKQYLKKRAQKPLSWMHEIGHLLYFFVAWSEAAGTYSMVAGGLFVLGVISLVIGMPEAGE